MCVCMSEQTQCHCFILLDVEVEEGEKCFEGLLGAELDILTSVRKLSTEHTSQLQGDVFSLFYCSEYFIYVYESFFHSTCQYFRKITSLVDFNMLLFFLNLTFHFHCTAYLLKVLQFIRIYRNWVHMLWFLDWFHTVGLDSCS